MGGSEIPDSALRQVNDFYPTRGAGRGLISCSFLQICWDVGRLIIYHECQPGFSQIIDNQAACA